MTQSSETLKAKFYTGQTVVSYDFIGIVVQKTDDTVVIEWDGASSQTYSYRDHADLLGFFSIPNPADTSPEAEVQRIKQIYETKGTDADNFPVSEIVRVKQMHLLHQLDLANHHIAVLKDEVADLKRQLEEKSS